MKNCKVCGAKLSLEENLRGTCNECETIISKLAVKKVGRSLYSKKLRLI